MLVGTLDAVRRYPVKSLRAESLECAVVTPSGIEGDRTSALFVASGNARVGKTYRGKENDRLHLISDEETARADAASRGVAVDVRRGERFFDDAPLSIIVDCWLDELRAHLGYAVEWERFRPNFFVRATLKFRQSEWELQGAELRVGLVRLRVRSPIERCVAITYHPRGEPSDPQILRFIAQQRAASMGIYCDVLEPGKACVGDSLMKEAPLS
ncbi:MAG TPA: MOSC domain-containing protein [Candidatus Cybelea sp.]